MARISIKEKDILKAKQIQDKAWYYIILTNGEDTMISESKLQALKDGEEVTVRVGSGEFTITNGVQRLLARSTIKEIMRDSKNE